MVRTMIQSVLLLINLHLVARKRLNKWCWAGVAEEADHEAGEERRKRPADNWEERGLECETRKRWGKRSFMICSRFRIAGKRKKRFSYMKRVMILLLFSFSQT